VAEIVAPMKNVEWVEVLPFHQMGEFKWKALGLDYKLADTPTPVAEQVHAALEIFRAAGCRAR
jgi:pyruvate formate lyase activating enzyme